MRFAGIRTAVCALVVALAAETTASAGWPGYYGGGWNGYGTNFGYNGINQYGYYPWTTGPFYDPAPLYYSYYSYPRYYSYYSYPAYSYSYWPSYVVPESVVTAPTTREYQSFYPAETSRISPPRDEAAVVVRTAADAELWFDGVATKQTGRIRTFETPELRPGKGYLYEVRVRWMENGMPVERMRTVAVAAGQTVDIDLTPSTLKK
jgi:uncharacterized protein (TIGR03000 family)